MGTGLNNAAFMHDAYYVGVLYGRQPVSNNHGRAVAHQSVKSLLHKFFALAVKCRGGLVENEDGRILEDGPGD